jgi:mannosylglycerate hydrolase
MRDGPVGAVHTDVYTIHPEVMMENSFVENKVLRWAEPLSTFAWIYGLDRYPATYLEKIWKLMFQSHAHDSMHGLGPTPLVEGELARLKQASVVAQGPERRALQNITKEIQTDDQPDTDFFVAVHNPSSFARTEVVEAYVDVPRDFSINHLILEDMEGNPVQVQEVERIQTRAGLYHPRSRNMPFYCTRVHLYFLANGIPALGYKTFKMKWKEKSEYPYPHEDWDAPRIYAEDLSIGANKAENEFMKVEINPDGTVWMTDKQTGRVYDRLNYFLDAGDKGNMWMSESPANDRVMNSIGLSAKIARTLHGPLIVKFEVSMTMKLPASFDWQKQVRSDSEVEMPIVVEYILRKGCPYLEVKTRITNTTRDHYLKVCFPTGLKAEKTWAEGSFSVTEFPVKPSVQGDLRGNELARHPAQLWFDISDGHQGMAVLSDSSKDYEVLEHDEHQTLAMGLVRSVRLRIPCDNRLWMEYPGDESAQSLRGFSYRYALMPHGGLWENAGLTEQALGFNAPLHICQFGKQKGILPVHKSFLELGGQNLVLSCLKKAEQRNAVIVRMYNPTNQDVTGVLKVGFDFKEAVLVNLNEEQTGALERNENSVTLNCGRGKIVTVELKT